MAKPPTPVPHLEDHFEDMARKDPHWAIAYALMRLAKAQEKLANEVRHLGNGNAASNGVGAIEGFSMIVRDGMADIANSLNKTPED